MFMFLRDAEKFAASLHVAPTAGAAADEKEEPQFSEFVQIVDKYIRDGAPFEVNIDSKTKIEVLRMTDRGVFNNQTRVGTRTFVQQTHVVAAFGVDGESCRHILQLSIRNFVICNNFLQKIYTI